MRRILTIALLLASTLAARADAAFPKVSTDTEEHWYYIQMQNGMGVLASQGDGRRLVTAEAAAARRSLQVWKVVKGSGSRYKFVAHGGQVMYYDTSAGRFQTAASPSGGYQEFQIVRTASSSYQGYELYADQKGDSYAYLNQWGGAGIGRELGLYAKGDVNNPLQFVAEEDMEFTDVRPADVTEVAVRGTDSWTPASKHTLWYTKPATVWMTSTLPIGNGQFGACIMGGVRREDVQFNDKTLWRGHVNGIVGNGSYGSYLNFGHVYITSTDESLTEATNYRRWLDIDEGQAGVAYTANGVDYERKYIASYPDQVVAIKYTASARGCISQNVILYNANGTAPKYTLLADGSALAVFSGEATRTGTASNESFCCMARVVPTGGQVSLGSDGGINVAGADEMTVYLFGATNFSTDNDEYIYPAEQLPANVEKCVEAAVGKGFDAVLADHVKDYKALYDRCQLSITEQQNTVATPTLISNFARNNRQNLLLEEMYFCYGRYLMIASSRGVSLPSNLQGIWNNSNSPAWNSDIHSNINVQMNYWPAEVTNLSELHLPFLEYIKREACDRPQWQRNARQIGGQTKGWTLTTENNIYGSGSNWMQNYTIANAWYCMHLWQHYRYTLDREYLEKTALPAMKSCCEYWLERLVKAKDGTYECPNEYSPEHGPGSENATAHSQQLVWDLFNNTRQAYEVISHPIREISEDEVRFLDELHEKFKNLDRGTAIETVGDKKLLREWKYTSQNTVGSYNSHRHLSHLMGLYPGNQIAEDIDKDIYDAAINSLNTRGYEGTGWSMGWKVNCHARAKDGDRCQSLLATALHIQTYTGNSEGGGVYENLWDAHTPYQIDGNFGACAGMAEMLLQSHTGKMEVLPALPSAWSSGSVKGLRAVGAFQVDISWKAGLLETVAITSDAGQRAVVKYPNGGHCFEVASSDGKSVEIRVDSDNEISFDTERGCVYTLRYDSSRLPARYDGIADGDYAVAFDDNGTRLYLRQLSTQTGDVGMEADPSASGVAWTLTGYEATAYPSYGTTQAWEKQGKVYYLQNRDLGIGIKNRFMKATTVNASSLHPIYLNRLTGLMAIRSTNLDSNKNSNDGWYGVADGKPDAASTSPLYCWLLIPYSTVGVEGVISDAGQAEGALTVYDLQGRKIVADGRQVADGRGNTWLFPKGIYILGNKKLVVM